MEFDTLVENADFDDVDDNDFGEDDPKVLGGDKLGGDEPKLERFSIKIDLTLTNEPKVKEGSFKGDIENTDCGLEVKNELKDEETVSAEWKTNDLLPEGWKFKEVEGDVQFLSKEGTNVTSDEVKNLLDFKLKLESDNWKTSEFLPKGWMGKKKKAHLGTIFVKSDDGAIFHSYRKATAFMKINDKYGEEDLKKLYLYPDGIRHRFKKWKSNVGWKTNEYLPEGWKYKPKKKGTLLKSSEGVKLTSYKAASAFMKKAENYTTKDIERLHLYPDGKEHMGSDRRSKSEWKTNEYLPEGWKCKPARGGIIKLKSDDGNTFSTYKDAAAFVKDGKQYCKEDVERLFLYPDGLQRKRFRKLEKTGSWKTNPYLPEGWTCKKLQNKFAFLVKTEEGFKISTFKAARAFMGENKKYGEEDFNKLKLYPDGVSKRIKSERKWKTNKYLPAGWTGNFENKRNPKLQSADGTKFFSLRAAAAFMESDGRYTENDVNNIYFCPDGRNQKEKSPLARWKTSKFLPSGWTCQKAKVGSDLLKIQSDCGSIFTSHFDASVFMNLDPLKYSKEDVRRLNLYPDGKPHLVSPEKAKDRRIVEDFEEEKQKNVENEQDDSIDAIVGYDDFKTIEREQTEEQNEDVEEEQDKETEDGQDKEKYIDLEKERDMGKDHDDEDMEHEDVEDTSNDDEEENLEERRTGESEDEEDWDTSMYLPEGWLCKENQDPESSKLFLKSENGTRLRSYKAAVTYMETNSRYTSADIEMLSLYPDGNYHNNYAIQSVENSFQPDENLKINQTAENTENQMLPIQDGLRNHQSDLNWGTSEYLPEGWMCKPPSSKSFVILLKSSDNTKIQSYKAAAAYMEADSKYTKDDVDRLYRYPDGKNHNPQKMWSTSKYLPEGWMCSDMNTNSSKIRVKTDDNIKLKSYRAAAAYMEADPQYNQDDVDKLYQYPDGKNHNVQVFWSTSIYLPEGWMCSDSNTKSGNINVKTDDETKLQSYKAAAAYMEANPKYTDDDIEKMYYYPDGKNRKQHSQSVSFQGTPKEEMQKSKYLPEGWTFRDKKKGLDILTSDGTKLESYIAVNRYMLFKQTFTKKQMDMVYLFPDGKNHKKGSN